MSWLSKIFGAKKEEVKAEAPVSAPAEPITSEVPMTGVTPEVEEATEETEEAGSEEMK
jgi:hypothetical protein